MKFKSAALREEFWNAHPVVRQMAIWFEQLCLVYFQKDPTITRVLEDIPGATKTHPEGRAIDFRDEFGGKREFSDEEVRFLVSEMNKRFQDPSGMKSCVHHSFAGGPMHFHLQISRALAASSGAPEPHAVV